MKGSISLVVAMGRNRVIGREGGLPWHLPADLRHFRAVTMGKPIVMGRKTAESIGRPLPGRANIVVTRQPDYRPNGFQVHTSLDTALAALADTPEIMVIGGASIYTQTLPLADRIHLTIIHQDFEGDSYFPAHDPSAWNEAERIDHHADEANHFDYSFLILDRRIPKGTT